MTDEEFEKELEELNGLLRALRRIHDREAKKQFKYTVRRMINNLVK